MAVVYEEQEDGMVKAYSDQHKKIFGGFPEGIYDVAYDPIGSGRTYEETEEWIDTYTQPQQGRVFSKLYLELALFNSGLLDAVDQFIDSQSITNEHGETMPLRRLYETALTFSEDNEYFVQFKTSLQTLLGISDEQLEGIFSASVARSDSL